MQKSGHLRPSCTSFVFLSGIFFASPFGNSHQQTNHRAQRHLVKKTDPKMMLSSAFRSVASATSSILKRSATATTTSRFASTLVVSDPLLEDGSTPACTQSAVTAAGQLGQSVDLLVVSSKPPSKVPDGVTKIYYVSCGDRLAETVASSIQAVATSKDCNIVLGSSSKFGNTVIPRAAALLESSPITDILEIHDASTYHQEN